MNQRPNRFPRRKNGGHQRNKQTETMQWPSRDVLSQIEGESLLAHPNAQRTYLKNKRWQSINLDADSEKVSTDPDKHRRQFLLKICLPRLRDREQLWTTRCERQRRRQLPNPPLHSSCHARNVCARETQVDKQEDQWKVSKNKEQQRNTGRKQGKTKNKKEKIGKTGTENRTRKGKRTRKWKRRRERWFSKSREALVLKSRSSQHAATRRSSSFSFLFTSLSFRFYVFSFSFSFSLCPFDQNRQLYTLLRHRDETVFALLQVTVTVAVTVFSFSLFCMACTKQTMRKRASGKMTQQADRQVCSACSLLFVSFISSAFVLCLLVWNSRGFEGRQAKIVNSRFRWVCPRMHIFVPLYSDEGAPPKPKKLKLDSKKQFSKQLESLSHE